MNEDIQLLHGDCLDLLRAMPDNSIDSIVTDPPYGLSFMGKKWDYDVPSVDIWRECLRVLKHGGHLLSFGGSRTYHRMVVAIEDAGFEIRDQIMWVYGSGFPKSHNLKDDWQGWGTALKPAHEPICLARKPLIGTVAENVLAHGTGALDIDGCRVGDTGRWPANFIHDGSDEVMEGFPITTSGSGNKNTGNRDCLFGSFGAGNGFGVGGDTGSAARFFYCAKASKKDRDEGLNGFEKKLQANAHFRPNHLEAAMSGDSGKPHGRYTPRANNHPTVKPTDLMRYLCRLITPPNGVVLDPFMGSGSTGKAAVSEGFRFIGMELDEGYFDIARSRIDAAKALSITQLAMTI